MLYNCISSVDNTDDAGWDRVPTSRHCWWCDNVQHWAEMREAARTVTTAPPRWLFRRLPRTEASLQLAKPSETLWCICKCSLHRSAASLWSRENTLPSSCSPLLASEKPSCVPAHETSCWIKPISANKPECSVLVLIILPPPNAQSYRGGGDMKTLTHLMSMFSDSVTRCQEYISPSKQYLGVTLRFLERSLLWKSAETQTHTQKHTPTHTHSSEWHFWHWKWCDRLYLSWRLGFAGASLFDKSGLKNKLVFHSLYLFLRFNSASQLITDAVDVW